MDKFTRLLTLVALLEQREQPQTFEEIKEELGPDAYPQRNPESARRSFERDKDDLLAMGVPLRADPMWDDPSNTGYTITRERSRVADPGFTPAEMAALRMAATALALREDGVSELADASDGLRKYGGMAAPSAEAAGTGEATVAEIRLDSNITEVFGAVVERRRIAFAYNDRTRQVTPLQLSSISGNWYLNCHDHEAGQSRTYRLDRIEGSVISAVDESGAAPAGEARVVETQSGTNRFRPWEFGDGDAQLVRVRLDAPAASVALA
ncbi:MAG: helix-turn-helix transcriptional regulator, partial [Microthrixaceae bacterium]